MDEQTTAQASNYDISADGAVDTGYEEEPLEPTQPETSTEPEELPPDGARLNDDGNVEFGDEFFGDLQSSPEDDPAPEAPQYYTDEELKQIPFNQWDLSRLDNSVGVNRYALIVREQLQRQKSYVRSQEMQRQPLPPDIVEPKQYTPKELSEGALKLACEKLGIEDADDFDSYEPEHKAAYELASQELREKRNAEISSYQGILQSWNENRKYQEELAQRPDFGEFERWYLGECQKAGYTPAQVEAGLYKVVQQAGNNFGVIRPIMEGWYQQFQQENNRLRRIPSTGKKVGTTQGNVRLRRVPRTSPPPVLESTRGNNYAGRPSIKAEAFADMTSDEQAEALIQLGLV